LQNAAAKGALTNGDLQFSLSGCCVLFDGELVVSEFPISTVCACLVCIDLPASVEKLRPQ